MKKTRKTLYFDIKFSFIRKGMIFLLFIALSFHILGSRDFYAEKTSSSSFKCSRNYREHKLQQIDKALEYSWSRAQKVCQNRLLMEYDSDKECDYFHALRKRYSFVQGKKQKRESLFIAINLHNSQHVLPNMIHQIMTLLDVLEDDHPHYFSTQKKRKKVFVSVFESGSTDDQTKSLLNLWRLILQEKGIENHIVQSRLSPAENAHRIEFLADVRNRALEPMLNPNQPRKFDRVLFVNDVLFCASDVLKLMEQVINQDDISMACGMDFDLDKQQQPNKLGFYDTWVARDIQGNPFNKWPATGSQLLSSDAQTNALLTTNKPAKVMCCWNGMALLKAEPFYKGLRFRRAWTTELNPASSNPLQFHTPKGGQWSPNEALQAMHKLHGKNTPIYTECSGSEISQLCKDLIQRNYQKFIVIPGVKLAYEIEVFELINSQLPTSDEGPIKPRLERALEISWLCKPLNAAHNRRDPDGVEGRELVLLSNKP